MRKLIHPTDKFLYLSSSRVCLLIIRLKNSALKVHAHQHDCSCATDNTEHQAKQTLLSIAAIGITFALQLMRAPGDIFGFKQLDSYGGERGNIGCQLLLLLWVLSLSVT